jgi:hypothetical protein
MFGKSLKAVLAEYREEYAPHTPISSNDLSESIGFMAAQYAGVPSEKMTEQQKRSKRAAAHLTRCKRLLMAIEKYERV